ncbi:hypothetical protein AHAS_Ahas13G0504600 [Arachis hypogaea]
MPTTFEDEATISILNLSVYSIILFLCTILAGTLLESDRIEKPLCIKRLQSKLLLFPTSRVATIQNSIESRRSQRQWLFLYIILAGTLLESDRIEKPLCIKRLQR